MHIFHKWGPWVSVSSYRQVRYCQHKPCNMRKSRYVW